MKKHDNLNINLSYYRPVTDIEKVFVTSYIRFLENIDNTHIHCDMDKRIIYKITTEPEMLFYRKPSQLFEVMPILHKSHSYFKELTTLLHAMKMYEGMVRFV